MIRNTLQLGCFGHGHLLALVGNEVGSSCVSHLLRECRPPDIHFRAACNALFAMAASVVTVVVDAVNAVARCWSLAHISQERLKGFSPTTADKNTVRLVASVSFPVASRDHARPVVVLGGSGEAVSATQAAYSLNPHAPASCGDASLQVIGHHTFGVTALASAVPMSLASSVRFGLRDDGQLSKYGTDLNVRVLSGPGLTSGCHFDSPCLSGTTALYTNYCRKETA